MPERIAYLILMYMHQTLSLAERDELDLWVEKSDENMELFAEATDIDHINLWYQLSRLD